MGSSVEKKKSWRKGCGGTASHSAATCQEGNIAIGRLKVPLGPAGVRGQGRMGGAVPTLVPWLSKVGTFRETLYALPSTLPLILPLNFPVTSLDLLYSPPLKPPLPLPLPPLFHRFRFERMDGFFSPPALFPTPTLKYRPHSLVRRLHAYYYIAPLHLTD